MGNGKLTPEGLERMREELLRYLSSVVDSSTEVSVDERVSLEMDCHLRLKSLTITGTSMGDEEVERLEQSIVSCVNHALEVVAKGAGDRFDEIMRESDA